VPHWYDPGKEASMIELTEQQVEALDARPAGFTIP
jgi:hypothetical protein